jgi:hypothetical protein
MSGFISSVESKYVEFRASLSDTWTQFEDGRCLKNFSTFDPWKKTAIVVIALAIAMLVGAFVAGVPFFGALLSVPSSIFTSFVSFAYLTKPSIGDSVFAHLASYFNK